MTGLEQLAMEPKPIPHVYREIGSLRDRDSFQQTFSGASTR